MIFYAQQIPIGPNSSRCQAQVISGVHRCDSSGYLRPMNLLMCTRHWNMYKQNPVFEEWSPNNAGI